jgi:hypothetical protein
MTSNFATLDLETISTAEEVIVTALQNQITQWEQDAQDAIAAGHLATAQQFQNWSFAADFLATTASIEISALMGKVLHARFGDSTGRPLAEQILDALTIQVASGQEEPVSICNHQAILAH